MLGTQKHLDRITDFIDKYMDVPLGDADSRLHIKEIRYAKAEDLKPILDDVIKPPRGQGSDKSVIVGEYKFFEDVTIVAEKASVDQSSGPSTRGGGNRLIVACTKDDWRRLEKVIEKLDKPQPQIAFEIMIINVQTEELKQLGSQHFGFFGRQPGMGINEVEFSNLSAAQTEKSGEKFDANHYIQLATSDFEGQGHPSFLTIGRAGTPDNPNNENIWSIIKMVFNVDNSHIIAQPFLVTNNNQPCREEITRTQRIKAGLVSGKGEPSKVQMQDFPASTKIELTPRMNLDGVVDLDIQVEVSEFENTDPEQAKKSNRLLKTRTSVLSGEVLVLGGLTKKRDDDEEDKTPILGDIPIIGSLFFKNKKKNRAEQNLYIFIRPSIIKPKADESYDEYTQLKLDYAKYQLLKNDTYLKDKDPIQRWFFKPPDQSIKQKLLDGKRGIIRPLDNFVSAKFAPRMVNLKEDSYFKVSEELEKQKISRPNLKS
ncbi:MAG: General secretion pathway protein D [candidate division TM6 bacterium GW2011_GWF2_37_49]|nr:MAG: General secretion pathway protein D [candidate division TM6 bacterium GW2011_GWF2_37_49]